MVLKVCQIIPTLVQGGAEKQMLLLAKNLDRKRFESHVIVLTHSGPLETELRASGVHVHHIHKARKVDPLAYMRLKKTLRTLAPTVVQTWLFAANSYGRLAAHQTGVPIIINGERCVDPWKSRWNFMVDRFLEKWTTCTVTNTRAISEFYAGHGLNESKFHVIPNAVVPSERPKISREECFARLGIPPRSKLVGAVGRLWKQKGYRDLAWASELLRVAYQDVWVVVVGDGPELRRLQQLRDLYHAHNALRFVGHRKDASQLMSAFDVLWNGSLYEGQSNTILEAMAHGVPVVASDIPGNRDLVIPDETGYLFELGDTGGWTKTTNNLLRDPERMQRLGANAKRRVEQEFSLDKMIASYESLYERLATAGGNV